VRLRCGRPNPASAGDHHTKPIRNEHQPPSNQTQAVKQGNADCDHPIGLKPWHQENKDLGLQHIEQGCKPGQLKRVDTWRTQLRMKSSPRVGDAAGTMITTRHATNERAMAESTSTG